MVVFYAYERYPVSDYRNYFQTGKWNYSQYSYVQFVDVS